MIKKPQRTTFCSLTIRLWIQPQIINSQNKEKLAKIDEEKVNNFSQKETPKEAPKETPKEAQKDVKKEEIKINVNETPKVAAEPKEPKKEEEKSKSPFLLKKNFASPKMGGKEGGMSLSKF